MNMTVENAITRLRERLATRCFGGDDDGSAVEMLLNEMDRLKARRRTVHIIVGPAGPVAVHEQQTDAIKDCQERNRRRVSTGVKVESWIVQQ
jgi:hypothetical protein